jgi:hypothetical protein
MILKHSMIYSRLYKSEKTRTISENLAIRQMLRNFNTMECAGNIDRQAPYMYE